MSFDQRSLEELVRELPPESQARVREFVESLQEIDNGVHDNPKPTNADETADRTKREAGHSKKLEQNWAGALSDFREQYTSIELQQKSLEWRGD